MAPKLLSELFDTDRREFLARVGKGLGLAAMTSGTVLALLEQVQAAAKQVDLLAPSAAAEDEDFWHAVQQAFPVSRGLINLNNGGVSPSPKIVTESLQRYEWQQEEATAYVMWQILEPQSETIRTGLAELFGCDREEIAITRNASESLEHLLFGFDLKRGDEILTTDQDYPRMITTLRQREVREGIALKLVKIPIAPADPMDLVRAYEAAITPRTRIMLVSHVIFMTGQIMPVRELCALGRDRGIEVVVDGAHAFAHLRFSQNDLGCDYYGTSLHKWLHAPKGTGMLYVKRDRIDRIWPLFAADAKQKADIRKFEEIGTHSAAPRLAIGEALLFHQSVGPARKEARLRFLARYWMNNLRNLPKVRFHTSFDDRQSCGIATMEIEGMEPNAIVGHLMGTHKIIVTNIIHDNFRGVRVTPNVYTTLPELDRFCEAVASIARKGIPGK